MNAQKLRAFAIQHNLDYIEDPFHASTCYEFRRGTSKGYDCLGFLFGTSSVEVYRRELMDRNSRESINYEVITTIPLMSCSEAKIEEMVASILLNKMPS
jgi:hypothetical protein